MRAAVEARLAMADHEAAKRDVSTHAPHARAAHRPQARRFEADYQALKRQHMQQACRRFRAWRNCAYPPRRWIR
jgi:hypothetical protein